MKKSIILLSILFSLFLILSGSFYLIKQINFRNLEKSTISEIGNLTKVISDIEIETLEPENEYDEDESEYINENKKENEKENK